MTRVESLICNRPIQERVREARKLGSKKARNVIFASTMKLTGAVQPPRAFKSNWKDLPVTVHDESLLTPLMPRLASSSNRVTLGTFLGFPELHQNVTLMISGLARKGKSELAKYCCMELAFMYQSSDTDPRFIQVTTIDALRSSQHYMEPGVPVLLDDIGGDDEINGQIIYSTVSIWKSILQCKDAVQNRGRNDDIQWAARQPKMLTTNCKGLKDWIETMFPRTKKEHTDAIYMRVAETDYITESLFAHASALSGSQHFLPMQLESGAARAMLGDLF